MSKETSHHHAGPTLPGAERPSYLYYENFLPGEVPPFTTCELDGTSYVMEGMGLFKPTDASPEEVESLYDFWAESELSYDAQVSWTIEVGRQLGSIALRQEVIGKVLDVCCGTGNVSEGLIQSGIDTEAVTGLDISTKMLARARAKPQLSGATFIVADIAVAELLPHTYDLIVAVLGLSNLSKEHWATVTKKLLQSLTPNGSFVLVETQRPKSSGNQFTRFLQEYYGGRTTARPHAAGTYPHLQLDYTTIKPEESGAS